MRVLIATEEQHTAYREVIADALRSLRPDLEISSASTPKLHDALARVAPHVVVCDRAIPEIHGAWTSWFYLSLAPDRPSEADVYGSRWQTTNPGLDDLLSVVEHTEKALATAPEQLETAR